MLYLLLKKIWENGGIMNSVEIGDRIRKRRKELGLTQTKIQEETGISSGNLSLIENGKTLPSSSALFNLSNLLQCSIDYLLKGESLNSKNLDMYNFKDSNQLSDVDIDLLDLFHNLTPDDQEEIIEMIKLKIKRKVRQRKSLISEDEIVIETA